MEQNIISLKYTQLSNEIDVNIFVGATPIFIRVNISLEKTSQEI